MDELESKINSLFSSPESMERIMQLAQSLSGGEREHREDKQETERSDAPGFDPKLMGLVAGAMQEFSSQGEADQLCKALRPILSQEKAERLDRALGIARLVRVARKVLPQLGGGTGNV